MFAIGILAAPFSTPNHAEKLYQPIPFVRRILEDHFAGHSLSWADRARLAVSPFQGGVFVTLSREGKTRACWGRVDRQYSTPAQALRYTTLNALTKEYRFGPVRRSELAKLKIQITLIRDVRPVFSLAGQNPLHDALMIRAGSLSAVILPGEAASAHHQLVLAKLKAGIDPKTPYQLYRLSTHIYRE